MLLRERFVSDLSLSVPALLHLLVHSKWRHWEGTSQTSFWADVDWKLIPSSLGCLQMCRSKICSQSEFGESNLNCLCLTVQVGKVRIRGILVGVYKRFIVIMLWDLINGIKLKHLLFSLAQVSPCKQSQWSCSKTASLWGLGQSLRRKPEAIEGKCRQLPGAGRGFPVEVSQFQGRRAAVQK